MFSGRKDSANRKQMQIYLQFAEMQLNFAKQSYYKKVKCGRIW